jgi:hypothetical protein
MHYHYLSTPSQSAVTKCHIFWWISVTDHDFSKNRNLSIHHFFDREKWKLAGLDPQGPVLDFVVRGFVEGLEVRNVPTERRCQGSGMA